MRFAVDKDQQKLSERDRMRRKAEREEPARRQAEEQERRQAEEKKRGHAEAEERRKAEEQERRKAEEKQKEKREKEKEKKAGKMKVGAKRLSTHKEAEGGAASMDTDIPAEDADLGEDAEDEDSRVLEQPKPAEEAPKSDISPGPFRAMKPSPRADEGKDQSADRKRSPQSPRAAYLGDDVSADVDDGSSKGMLSTARGALLSLLALCLSVLGRFAEFPFVGVRVEATALRTPVRHQATVVPRALGVRQHACQMWMRWRPRKRRSGKSALHRRSRTA